MAVESAGVPVPGETALITAGLLAADHRLSIELVIVFAAVAAIVGDNVGYQLGQRLGRRALTRSGRLESVRRSMLERSERFFDRHGPKAVFLGRWVAGLRVWASWLAGATHMPWPTFIAWNALGGIAWATSVGLAAYALGRAAADAFKTAGEGLAAVVVVGAVVAVVVIRRRERI